MNELLKIFNALVLYDYNVRVLHWKVIGLGFGTKHEMMDSYHDQLNSMIDEVAECILMLHGTLPSFTGVFDYVRNDEETTYVLLNGAETFTVEAVLEQTRKMFTQLIDFYQKATENSEIPGDIVSKLQEHQYWLRLETRYKLDSHLG